MGAGALTVKHETTTETFVDNMLSDERQMAQIFKDIRAKTEPFHPRNTISYNGVMKYYHECCHPFFLRFVQTEKILQVAHRYVTTKCKGAGSTLHKDLIPKSHFILFIDTVYLFSHLWTIFVGLEDDHKLDKNEFLGAKGKIFDSLGSSVHLNVSLTDEEWMTQFDKFDSNNDGHISFVELCTYVVDGIVKPEDFATFDHYDEDEEESDELGGLSSKESTGFISEDQLSQYSSGNQTVMKAEKLVNMYKTKIKVIEHVLDHVDENEMQKLLKENTHASITEKVDTEMTKLRKSTDKTRRRSFDNTEVKLNVTPHPTPQTEATKT